MKHKAVDKGIVFRVSTCSCSVSCTLPASVHRTQPCSISLLCDWSLVNFILSLPLFGSQCSGFAINRVGALTVDGSYFCVAISGSMFTAELKCFSVYESQVLCDA